jgi:hypothetical protein
MEEKVCDIVRTDGDNSNGELIMESTSERCPSSLSFPSASGNTLKFPRAGVMPYMPRIDKNRNVHEFFQITQIVETTYFYIVVNGDRIIPIVERRRRGTGRPSVRSDFPG